MNFKTIGRKSRAAIAAGLLAVVSAFGMLGCSGTNQATVDTAQESVATETVQNEQHAEAQNVTDETSNETVSQASVSVSAGKNAISTDRSGKLDVIELLDMFTERDIDPSYEQSESKSVTFNGTEMETSLDGIIMLNGTANIISGGTYVLSGNLTGGISVNVADTEKVQLVLDNLSIENAGAFGIYIKNADKTFITLADGTENSISIDGDAIAVDDTNIDAAIFSEDDLVINGTGKLSVNSALTNGIVSKDDLKLVSGNVTVSAKGHALQANDSIRATGGEWTLTSAEKDGMHCENAEDTEKGWVYIADGTFTVHAGTDGIDASGNIQIDSGTFFITAGDDGIHSDYDLAVNNCDITVLDSYEGIEAARITVKDGRIVATSQDDAFNASGNPSTDKTQEEGANGFGDMMGYDETAMLTIDGGFISVDTQGDGLDSNGDIIVNGGTTYVSGPANDGNGSLDVGEGGKALVNGGILMAAGSSGMALPINAESAQGSALVSLQGTANTSIVLKDTQGNTLANFTPTQQYQCVTVSAPGMAQGGTYLLSNDSETREFTLELNSYSDVSTFGMHGMGHGLGAPMDGGFGQTPGTAPGGMGQQPPQQP